jgi:hypothetical protein
VRDMEEQQRRIDASLSRLDVVENDPKEALPVYEEISVTLEAALNSPLADRDEGLDDASARGSDASQDRS